MEIDLDKEDILKAVVDEGYQDDIDFIVEFLDTSTSTYEMYEKSIIKSLISNTDSAIIIIEAVYGKMNSVQRAAVDSKLNN